MLDDYAYGYTEISHPGEFEKIVGNVSTPHLRVTKRGTIVN